MHGNEAERFYFDDSNSFADFNRGKSEIQCCQCLPDRDAKVLQNQQGPLEKAPMFKETETPRKSTLRREARSLAEKTRFKKSKKVTSDSNSLPLVIFALLI